MASSIFKWGTWLHVVSVEFRSSIYGWRGHFPWFHVVIVEICPGLIRVFFYRSNYFRLRGDGLYGREGIVMGMVYGLERSFVNLLVGSCSGSCPLIRRDGIVWSLGNLVGYFYTGGAVVFFYGV